MTRATLLLLATCLALSFGLLFRFELYPVAPGMDAPYYHAFNWAAERQLRFGEEFISTYGPFGHLVVTAPLGELWKARLWFEAGIVLVAALVATAYVRAASFLGTPARFGFAALLLYTVALQQAGPCPRRSARSRRVSTGATRASSSRPVARSSSSGTRRGCGASTAGTSSGTSPSRGPAAQVAAIRFEHGPGVELSSGVRVRWLAMAPVAEDRPRRPPLSLAGARQDRVCAGEIGKVRRGTNWHGETALSAIGWLPDGAAAPGDPDLWLTDGEGLALATETSSGPPRPGGAGWWAIARTETVSEEIGFVLRGRDGGWVASCNRIPAPP